MAHRHEALVDWKHLVIYGAIVAVVIVIGVVAIWSFLQRQSLLSIQSEPLPKVTVVTADPNSKLAAAWVKMLSGAGLAATLVPLETFDPIEGVVIFCDIPEIPPRLAVLLEEFVRRGGALAFAGTPPRTAIGDLRLMADSGMSDDAIRMSENASPALARLDPNDAIPMNPVPVAFLKESPRMVVDARWAGNSRAVAVHVENKGARYAWFGLDPAACVRDKEQQLIVMLKNTFRWVVGQPLSDAAIGDAQVARTLAMSARRDAQNIRFTWNAERSPTDPDVLMLELENESGARILNPTVKIWLPPGVTKVALGSDWIARRNVTLTGLPEEGACVITMPKLGRNEVRRLKLVIVERRPAARSGEQRASR
jgi:hypothetical protein